VRFIYEVMKSWLTVALLALAACSSNLASPADHQTFGTVTPRSPAWIRVPTSQTRGAGGPQETVLYSFENNPDASLPDSGLVCDANGDLYGTTEDGGTFGEGAVFKLTPNGAGYSESVIYSFQGDSNPQGVAIDAYGNLYGTTLYGGEEGWEAFTS